MRDVFLGGKKSIRAYGFSKQKKIADKWHQLITNQPISSRSSADLRPFGHSIFHLDMIRIVDHNE